MAKIKTKTERVDIYTRVTGKIIADLEQGVRPWLKPWNTEHAAGRISRPLRSNGVPYQGINILMLWASAEEAGFNCPYWLTFQQAKELGGFVRKGEQGSPVIYCSFCSMRAVETCFRSGSIPWCFVRCFGVQGFLGYRLSSMCLAMPTSVRAIF